MSDEPTPIGEATKATLAQFAERWGNPPEALANEIEARERMWADVKRQERATKRAELRTALLYDLGPRHSRCTLDTYKVTHEAQRGAVAAVRRYIDELPDRLIRGDGLVFYGSCGTGKDHLAAALLLAAVEQGHTARFVNGERLWDMVCDGFRNDKPRKATVGPFERVDLLCVSDPVTRTASEAQAASLYRLVDARYNRMRPTIVTINAADEREAKAMLGVRTWSRLCDGGSLVVCRWPDYRQKGQP